APRRPPGPDRVLSLPRASRAARRRGGHLRRGGHPGPGGRRDREPPGGRGAAPVPGAGEPGRRGAPPLRPPGGHARRRPGAPGPGLPGVRTLGMTAPTISRRVQGFTESVIREMTRVNAEYGGVNLAQGFPNFPPPKELVEAAHRALDGDFHQYAI